MRRALESKNKIVFVDGTIEKPEEKSRRYNAWIKANNMVASWLVNSLISSIAQSVIWLDSAVEIWNDLKFRYGNADSFRMSDLQEEFYAIKQNNHSVTEYYTKLKGVWEELQVLRSVPSCTCHKCTCNLNVHINKFVENDCVIKFLKGLNEEFEAVKSQILLTSPLPDLKTAFAMAVKLERKTVYSSNQGQFSNNPSVVLNVNDASRSTNNTAGSSWQRSAGRGARRGGGKHYNSKAPTCSFCGMIGHTVDKCYKKHGYPPGFKPKGQVNMVTGDANMAHCGEVVSHGERGQSCDMAGSMPTPSLTRTNMFS